MQLQYLSNADYATTWQNMRAFVDAADKDTEETIWIVEHPPVFTLGQSGRAMHLVSPGEIPVIKTDRGGQVTYHGPGQLVLYPLLCLKRHALTARGLVTALETSVIQTLAIYGIAAHTRSKMPGVYVENAKIASIGLRIRRGWSYHGLSLNVDMDLEPFTRIDPCGYPDLQVTQIRDQCDEVFNMAEIAEQLIRELTHLLEEQKY